MALRGQVGEVGAERVPDERVELDRHLAGRIRELTQAQHQRPTLVVLSGIAALRLGGDALEIPDVPLPGSHLALHERDEDPGAFQWYLRRTIVNLVRSHFRRVRVERAYLQARAQERQEPAEPPDPGMRQELWQALLALPERQRTAIVLRFYEDMSEGRIAEVMGCPAGTVKSLISRGKERLRTTVTRGE